MWLYHDEHLCEMRSIVTKSVLKSVYYTPFLQQSIEQQVVLSVSLLYLTV